MGRFVAAVVAVGVIVVLLGQAPLSVGSWPGAVDRVWSVVSGSPQCEVRLTDGTTSTLPPQEAAALTTAAVTGSAIDPATTSAVGPEALDLAAPGAVSCTVARQDVGPEQEPGPLGLTPRAEAVHQDVLATFGRVPYGGFDPQGVNNGHGARSAHYEGRAVDYFFRPVGDEQQRARGWVLANWLVANAQRLEVAVIIFDDQIWSARRSAQGWRPYRNPSGGTDPISRHLDHVHVDVIRGG